MGYSPWDHKESDTTECKDKVYIDRTSVVRALEIIFSTLFSLA